MVEVTGVVPALAAVNDGVFPNPMAPNSFVVFELVLFFDPPAGVLANALAGTVVPAQ